MVNRSDTRGGVSLLRLGFRHGVWVAGLFFLIAMVFCIVARREASLASDFVRDGITTQAQITNKEQVSRRDSEGRNRITSYVTYRFELPTGETRTARQSVSTAFYHRVRLGDIVPVVYLPADPELSEIEPGSSRQTAIAFGAAAVLLSALGVGFGWYFGRSIPGMWRAAHHGEARQAEVMQHEEVRVRRGAPTWRLHWRDSMGAYGRSAANRLETVVDHPVGSRVTVLVDPRSGTAYWDRDVS